MKNHILLCFIILVFIAYTSANTLVRHSRQLDSRSLHDETSNNWAWGWDDSDDRPITRPTKKPTRRPTKRPTTTSSSISSTTVSSTTTTTTTTVPSTTSSTVPSTSSTVPSTSSTTPQIISSSTQPPVVTPNTVTFNRCMTRCIRTPEYNPLCADVGNGIRKQYNNQGEMDCANFCGENSKFLFRGSCTALI